MDLASLTILGIGEGGGAAAVTLMLERTLRPTLETTCEGLVPMDVAAWKQRRVNRAQDIVTTAAQRLQDSGQVPKPVPGRILWPLLEQGSLEEDPHLRKRWATLLANSARADSTVLPAFVGILAELSPVEVRLLDYLFPLENTRRDLDLKMDSAPSAERNQLNEDISAVTAELTGEVTMEHLERMTLVRYYNRPDSPTLGLRLTHVGFAFVKACSP